MMTYRSLQKIDSKDKGSFQPMYDLIEMLEQERNLTIVEYATTRFEKELRLQLGQIFANSVRVYNRMKQREIANHILHFDAKLTDRDVENLKEILLDEYENKKVRKDVLLRLCSLHCLDKETVLDLIGSQEQGVSRLAVDNLEKLMHPSDYDLDFLRECVAKVNSHDDTGTERRLVSKILEIDVKNGILALQDLNLVEIGAKRRLSAELIKHKEEIVATGVSVEALALAKECHKKAENNGWRDECLALVKELEDQVSTC